MKRFLTIAAATLLTLGGASGVRAQQYDPAPVVSNWYQRFLGHPADQQAMNYWVPQLQSQGPQTALAQMLASDEYLNRLGGTPDGLVLGLYRDVLNRTQLMPQDVEYWTNKMAQYGSREAMISEFLRDANVNVLTLGAANAAAAPAVVQQPAPIVVQPQAPIYAPAPAPVYTHRWWGYPQAYHREGHREGWFRFDRR